MRSDAAPGSGSGYLSALAATVLSPYAVHHCVERCPVLAARCRETFGRMPAMRHVAVHAVSAFDLDPETSTRYDRVYCGAGALAADAKFLAKFLKPGGLLVGPFEPDDDDLPLPPRPRRRFRHGRPQCLVKAVLASRSELVLEELMPVQFTPLARDDKQPKQSRVALKGPTWGLDDPGLFPPAFRLAVSLLARAGHDHHKLQPKARCYADAVPWHVWETRILACLAYDDVADDHRSENQRLLQPADAQDDGKIIIRSTSALILPNGRDEADDAATVAPPPGC